MANMIIVILLLACLSSTVWTGTHLDKPWFRWSNGVVNYFFQIGVANDDRVFTRSIMRQIEGKTCFRFKELASSPEPRGHHLEIRVLGNSTCLSGAGGKTRFSAVAFGDPPSKNKVVLQSKFKLADRSKCWKTTRGGLLHELFHIFGVMHTHMRQDRGRYVNILDNNIMTRYKYEYDVCHDCNDHGVPYDCSSIMHYGAETFSTGKWTMSSNRKSCDLRWVGAAFDGRGATNNDWELLKRISRSQCSTSRDKRPRKLRNGKSLENEISSIENLVWDNHGV